MWQRRSSHHMNSSFTPACHHFIVRYKKMSKPKFQIGNGPFIRINLPSKAPGCSEQFRGKAIVACNSLQCSAEVEFTRSDLELFTKRLVQVYSALKGSFCLVSTDTRFRIVGTADNKGRIRIDASISGFQFTQPENNEWTATANFTCFPHELEAAIAELTKANKS